MISRACQKNSFPRLILLAALALNICGASAMIASESPHTMATLSRRAAKPRERVELVVTVRDATQPSVIIPSTLPGLKFRSAHKPQLLTIDGQSVWLFRYRVTPLEIGDYEIPPLQVSDGNRLFQTRPLFLHVSDSGQLPQLSAKELSIGVNIPEPLSGEVLKAAPCPPLKPEPTPKPIDTRPLGNRIASTFRKEITAFWNFPGK